MADSIIEKIIKDFKTTLETITAGNNYENTIQSVQRMSPPSDVEGFSFNRIADVPVIFIQQGTTEILSESDAIILKRTQVHIGFATRIDTAQDSRPMDEILNSISADIEKALKADSSRSGNAIDTKFFDEDLIPIEEGQPEFGREMIFEVSYQHKWNDPFSIT